MPEASVPSQPARPGAGDPQIKFERDLSFLRSWLLGKQWWSATRALEYARGLHTGIRKDGFTPEFHHQVQIALNARTLEPFYLEPEAVFVACFLHDVPEDFDVGHDEIATRFGDRMRDIVERLTKKHRGIEKPYDVYFAEIAADQTASLVKGLDRCHNVWSMRDAFTTEKITSYADEIDSWFLPMLKTARRSFPEQEPAYQNIAHQLRSMRDIYRWALSGPDARAD